MITLVPLDTIDPTMVDALLDRAFGPDRFHRTAYTIRGQGKPLAALSFAAIETDSVEGAVEGSAAEESAAEGGIIVGSIQCWPIALNNDAGTTPLVMLGPVAVAPSHQGDGIGRRLMARALDAAATERLDGALMLIGDPDYYGRFFGFSAARTAQWNAPGPVERHRLLARGDAVPDEAGMLGPRLSVVASA